MRSADLVAHAFASIRQDLRQAILSLTGMVFGVAVVIAATAIAQGARRAALADVESMGVDNVIVRSDTRLLTTADADVVGRAIAAAGAVAPIRSTRLFAETARRSAQVDVLGVTPSWREVMDADVASGRWMTARDAAGRARVAVVGAGIAQRLFEGDPVGQMFRLGPDWYRVVGVLAAPAERQRPSPLARFDVSESVLVPLGAVDVRLLPGDRIDRVDEIAVRARTSAAVVPLASDLQALFKRRFPSAGAVRFIVPRELVAARLRARRAFDVVLVSIGCLVVVLSGLGIMNVTLAGIARRITEIGVRRAVGARHIDVVRQFAMESAALCLAGGVIGVPFGLAVTTVVGRLAGWSTAVTWTGAMLALALSAVVGLASGIYPARVAARWTPCEALTRGQV